MNAAAPTMIVVDLEKAARKVLKDPKGLSGVATTELVALAQFALLDDEEPRLSASLAAAVARVMKARDARMGKRGPAYLQATYEMEDAISALQTTFEQEFPK